MHRLIMNFPEEEIDHINGNKADNPKENLRLSNRAQQTQNCCVSKNNKSGVTGVSWFKRRNKWRVTFQCKSYGYYDDLNSAILRRYEVAGNANQRGGSCGV